MRKTSFLLLILLGVATALGVWVWQKNAYSTESLRLEIIAPADVAVGEEIVFAVKYKNNGDTRLENPILIFEFPQGAMPLEETRTRVTRTLEDISPGQEETIQFSARLFGKEKDLKEARAQLRYRPRGISATYSSETTTTVVLGLVPLNLDFDLPARVESGQRFDFRLNYFSRSEFPLANLQLVAEYPLGFTAYDVRPASPGEGEWSIGALRSAEGGRIAGLGIIRGDIGTSGVFRAKLGMWMGGEFIVLKEVEKTMEIVRPRLHISQAINEQVRDTVVSGELLRYEIFFRNVSERPLEDLFLVVTLEGEAFDRDSIQIQGGTYVAGSSSLAWEAKDHASLRALLPGEQGVVEFWARALEEAGENQTLRTRVLLSDARADFSVKVQSKPKVQQTVMFQDTVFSNAGPIPPRAQEQTTYTIYWKAIAGANKTEEVRVRAVLPGNVEPTGKISPLGDSFTFDPSSREVVWNIGSMGSRQEKDLAFQISLVPDSNQRGSNATLVGEVTLRGEDVFTRQQVSAQAPSVSTSVFGDDGVVR
ncbi:MAG: hypothetical protein Q8P70_01705 [bacterium]|nr:hypothetical protein [bacterium]